jgi:hypothetical protein
MIGPRRHRNVNFQIFLLIFFLVRCIMPIGSSLSVTFCLPTNRCAAYYTAYLRYAGGMTCFTWSTNRGTVSRDCKGLFFFIWHTGKILKFPWVLFDTSYIFKFWLPLSWNTSKCLMSNCLLHHKILFLWKNTAVVKAHIFLHKCSK